jgi:hypothetical protein
MRWPVEQVTHCTFMGPGPRHQPYCGNGRMTPWVADRRTIGQGRMSHPIPGWIPFQCQCHAPRTFPGPPGRRRSPERAAWSQAARKQVFTHQAASRTRPEKGMRRSRCRRISLVYLRGVPSGIRTRVIGLKVRLGKIQGERLSSMDEQKPMSLLSFLEHTVILSEVVDSHQNGHQTHSLDSRMDTTSTPRLCPPLH